MIFLVTRWRSCSCVHGHSYSYWSWFDA